MRRICHLRPARRYSTVTHYPTNGTTFGKMLLHIKCIIWFSLQHLHETVLILISTEIDVIKNVHWSSGKILEFSRQIFEKYSNTKIHENLSRGSRIAPCRQKNKWRDGRAQSLFEILQTRLKPWKWVYCSGTCGREKVALLLNQTPLHQHVRDSAGIASWILNLLAPEFYI